MIGLILIIAAWALSMWSAYLFGRFGLHLSNLSKLLDAWVARDLAASRKHLRLVRGGKGSR